MSFDVDVDGLRKIGRSLAEAAKGLEASGGSAPGAIDAGIMTPHIADLMAALTESSGELSVGLSAAADSLAATADTYTETDQTVADRVTIRANP